MNETDQIKAWAYVAGITPTIRDELLRRAAVAHPGDDERGAYLAYRPRVLIAGYFNDAESELVVWFQATKTARRFVVNGEDIDGELMAIAAGGTNTLSGRFSDQQVDVLIQLLRHLMGAIVRLFP